MKVSEARPRICFVAHNAFGAASGETAGHVGGIERQQTLMGRWLARRGYRTSIITWDEGQPDDLEIEGVRILKACRRDQGLRGLRFFHPRWTSLVGAMRRADADVYYQNCGEYVTGQVALWARGHRRKFVYSVASDPDCDPRLPVMRTIRERVLYRYGLRSADRIVVQTRRQQSMLREGFGLDSIVLPMPCEGPDEAAFRPPQPPVAGAARVAWVGRIAEVKRLELLLDVASVLPDVGFEVAGDAIPETPYFRKMRSRASAVRNVTLHGRVAREEMPALYERVACLLCTSHYEGFPNTFLEAWSHGLPVVSTVDPDRLIAERGLGGVAPDAAGLVARLRDLFGSPQRWLDASRSARRYYVEAHALDSVMPRFERVFLDVVEARA